MSLKEVIMLIILTLMSGAETNSVNLVSGNKGNMLLLTCMWDSPHQSSRNSTQIFSTMSSSALLLLFIINIVYALSVKSQVKIIFKTKFKNSRKKH